MKKTTILTFILGGLFGGAVTHHVMKNKKYYKAAFEVGEDLGEQLAEKLLTKIEDKMNKKEKKMIEYDHEPEVYPEDEKKYIPFEDFKNGWFDQNVKENPIEKTYVNVAELIIYDRFEVNSVPYDNKFNISKVYIDRATKKPIGVAFANEHDRYDALHELYAKFFDFFDSSTNITIHPLYGINIKNLDAIFETHFYDDYFKDEDAYYFWPSFSGFDSIQRDINNTLKTCGEKLNVICFGICTALSAPCITLNYHHRVDRDKAPKGIIYRFDKDELPIKIGFVNIKYADSCRDAINRIDSMSYRDFKNLLEDYNIYIHGDYTDSKMYITSVNEDYNNEMDSAILTIEWTKEEDAKHV